MPTSEKEKELESKFQARLKKAFLALGWAKVVRQLRVGANGEPDLILCHPSCPPVFVEVKRLGEPLKPLQQRKQDELRVMGLSAFRIDPSEMPLDPKRWSPDCFRLQQCRHVAGRLPVPLAETHRLPTVNDQKPPRASHLKSGPALARLRRLFIDANSPIEDGYSPGNQTIREWATWPQLNEWATNKVRYQGWTFLTARGVVDQAEDLMAALRRHADASGQNPFDPSFPTANLIEPSILPDEPEEITGAGEGQ